MRQKKTLTLISISKFTPIIEYNYKTYRTHLKYANLNFTSFLYIPYSHTVCNPSSKVQII